MPLSNARKERVLILAPRGRDAEVVSSVIGGTGATCETVAHFNDLVKHIMAGAGIAVIADEALAGADVGSLRSWLAEQESWSDFPFIVMLSRRMSKADIALKAALAVLGNVVILERPLSAETLGSAASSALRARRRQYQAREVLEDRQGALEQLAAFNGSLEAKVDDRTKALSQANDRLTAEVIEREKAQQAMSQYQKMESLGRLTGGVAHDFNNLLNVIQGSMDLLLLTNSDEAVRRRVTIAKSACARGAKLTSQLLAFARNQTLDLRPLSVSELFTNVVELAKPLLGSGIEILMSVGHDADLVAADANQMEMALLNLAINARDAMDGQGLLIFRSSTIFASAGELPEADYVKIEVSDNGPGMAPEVARRVFEPFFSTKAVGKGTGLGLSQVYGMAQQSGGAAFAHSVEGEGATIEIWLRRATVSHEESLVDKANLDALAGLRILLVEDDELVRAGMADALASFGCVVRQAACGAEGISELECTRPDVLLTDFLMPGMTGAELAAKARALYPELPVLVATGYADMSAIVDSLGDNVVLRKPFQISELANAVARVILKKADRVIPPFLQRA